MGVTIEMGSLAAAVLERHTIFPLGLTMPYSLRYVIFDLDDTLYPRGSGVMEEVLRLILHYMTERLGMDSEEASALRRRYLVEYGTTTAGLLHHRCIDPDDYLAYVHDIPVQRYLRANTELDRVLDTIPLSKAIWTNGTRAHAERVLRALGIRHHFSPILDIRDMGYVSKPAPELYPRLLEMLGAEGPECILVEDSVRNLRPAQPLDMITVLVGGDNGQDVDFVIPRVEEIGSVLQTLQRTRR